MNNTPEWWYTGFFLGLVIFLGLVLLICWGLFTWGQHQIDKLDHDIHRLDAAQKAFEKDLRRRMGLDE